MDTVALKKQLRKELNETRKALTPEEVLEKSAVMLGLWASHFQIPGVVHLFQPIAARREPDTSLFQQYLRRQHPGTRIVIPVVDPVEDKLIHVELTQDIELVENRWGIPEPRAPFKAVTCKLPDMVLVPLLGFDDQGNRLGYGKGHYDRFLSCARPDCLRVGLAFELSHLKALPTEPHDLRLHAVVTEERVYQFGV